MVVFSKEFVSIHKMARTKTPLNFVNIFKKKMKFIQKILDTGPIFDNFNYIIKCLMFYKLEMRRNKLLMKRG